MNHDLEGNRRVIDNQQSGESDDDTYTRIILQRIDDNEMTMEDWFGIQEQVERLVEKGGDLTDIWNWLHAEYPEVSHYATLVPIYEFAWDLAQKAVEAGKIKVNPPTE